MQICVKLSKQNKKLQISIVKWKACYKAYVNMPGKEYKEVHLHIQSYPFSKTQFTQDHWVNAFLLLFYHRFYLLANAMWRCTTIHNSQWKHILGTAESIVGEQSSGFSLAPKITHPNFQLNIISFGIMFSTNKQQKRLQTALSLAWAWWFMKTDVWETSKSSGDAFH